MNKNDSCFTPPVPQACCEQVPVDFFTLTIDDVDDVTTPPRDGEHRNTIVTYSMTGHIYMYDTFGIVTYMNASGVIDDELSDTSTNPVQNKVITGALRTEANNREEAVAGVQQEVEDERHDREEAINTIDQKINTEIQDRETAINSVNERIDTEIQDREQAISGVVGQIETEVQNREDAIEAVTGAIADEATARENADATLRQSDTTINGRIDAEITAREATDANVAQNVIDITANRDNLSALQAVVGENSAEITTNTDDISDLRTAINKNVVSDVAIDSTASTDVLVLKDSKVNIASGVTSSEEIPLPVASGTQAGIMNAATFNAVQSNSANIDVILNSSVAVDSLPSEPTQDELTTAWENATSQTSLVNGAKIYDVANDKIWSYFANDNNWHAASNVPTVAVNQWTNTMAGIIKGSEAEGQVFAEADGTGSVNGWDAVKTDISNNKSDIQTINGLLNNKVDKENGKGLSSNDFTTAEKNKLASIEDNANNYALPVATDTVLGGIKVGDNLSITVDGVLSGHKDFNGVDDYGDDLNLLRDDGIYGIQPQATNKPNVQGGGVLIVKSYVSTSATPGGTLQVFVSNGNAYSRQATIRTGLGWLWTEWSQLSQQLFSTTGQNTNGALTQKAATDAINGKFNTGESGNGTDLNSFTTDGVYGVDETCSNKPSRQGGMLVVKNYESSGVLDSGVVQIFVNSVHRVWTRSGSGTPVSWSIWVETSPILYTATGQNTDGAMTQKATTNALKDKLDKVTTATETTTLYGKRPDGSQFMKTAQSYLGPWTVPERDENNNFRAGWPVADNDVAIKKYVDDSVKVSRRKWSFNIEAVGYVAPYGAYGHTTIPKSEWQDLGIPIEVSTNNATGAPVPNRWQIESNGDVSIFALSQATNLLIYARITFIKGVYGEMA